MSALGAPQQEAARTEAQLVGAARAGDDRAFGELYERYGPRIFGYVLYMVRDHGRAEDICQDVFVSALRRIRTTDSAISFKPWLFEIAKNACIDEFRRLQRSQEVLMDQGSGEHLDAAAPSPDIHFERGQQLAALHGAFRGLSERQHKVLVLRELEGLSYSEIASRTGMTMAMVESTLLRARRRLGQEYDEIASGRRCEQVHQVIDAGGKDAVNALGLRERRRFVRHIVQCQPCGRYAQMAGIEQPERRLPAAVKRLAGLLPLPLTRWPFGRGGHTAGGFVRSARRVAQFAHPGASVSASPAAVATVAAVVIASGGAAVDLLSHEGGSAGRPAPAVVTARRTAVTSSPRASQRRVSVRAETVAATSQHATGADGSHSPRRGKGATRQADASPPGQHTSSSANSSGGNTQPTAPSSPSPVTTPSLPKLRQPITQAIHDVTNPIRDLTNPVKKILGDLGRHLPNPGGLLPQVRDILP